LQEARRVVGVQEIASMEGHISNQELAQAVRALQEQIQRSQEQIQQLQEQLQGQVNENMRLQEQMGYLGHQTQEGNTRQTIEANQDAAQRTKVAKPDLFYGERKKLQMFISQLELYFFFNAPDFPDEDRKVMFAATYLRGTAAQWFEPYLRDRMQKAPEERRPETNEVFNRFPTFVAKMKQNFGDLNEVRKATHTVMTIRQRTSVAAYTTEFQQAAAYLGDWSDRSLMEHYRRGLKDEIKKGLMIYKDPKDLNALINLAIKIDNHLFECRYQDGIPRHTNQRHTGNGGDAMELDSTNQKNPQKDKSKQSDKKPQGPNPNWTEEQKKHYEQKLCIHCGKNNHMGWKCPNKPKKEEKKQAATTQKKEEDHAAYHWTACYDDDCNIHWSEKDATGWYPKPPKSKN